jgi:hypothetical protein
MLNRSPLWDLGRLFRLGLAFRLWKVKRAFEATRGEQKDHKNSSAVSTHGISSDDQKYGRVGDTRACYIYFPSFGLHTKKAGVALQSLAIGPLCPALRALPPPFWFSNAGAK